MGTRKLALTNSWIDTGQGRVFARCWEPPAQLQKPPVILFHDSIGCVQLWRTFPATLAERTGRPVIAYDRLGFGESDPRTDRLKPAHFVGEEAEHFFPFLREQLRFGRFAAFGHSVGGAMAVHCAALYPDGCEALITESAQAFTEEKTLASIRQARELFQLPQEFERLQRYHRGNTRWVLESWIGSWLSPEFADFSLTDILPQVRCPVLAIHGSEDEYGSSLHPEMISALAGGPAQMEIMQGTRHVPHREQEEWVATRVAEFLSEFGS